MELVCQDRNSADRYMGKVWKCMSAAERLRVELRGASGAVLCWVEFQSGVWHSCQAGNTVPPQRTAEI